jgi:hypothetical protein
MATVPEQLRVRDERAKRGCPDKPNAWNALQTLALRIALVPVLKLFCDAAELLVDQRDRIQKARKRRAR